MAVTDPNTPEEQAWIERQLASAPPITDAQIERTAALIRNSRERRQAQARPKDAA